MPEQLILMERNDRTGGLNEKMDKTRSTYPWGLASGHYYYADSQVYTHLISVPSASRFVMQRMIVHNHDDPNELRFADGSGGSTSAFGMYINGSTTEFLGPDEVGGLIFESAVGVSNLTSQVEIRVWGYLIASQI